MAHTYNIRKYGRRTVKKIQKLQKPLKIAVCGKLRAAGTPNLLCAPFNTPFVLGSGTASFFS